MVLRKGVNERVPFQSAGADVAANGVLQINKGKV